MLPLPGQLLKILLFTMTLSTAAHSQDAAFYLGTNTSASSKGIYVGSIDSSTGKLGPVKLAAETQFPIFAIVSPDGKKVYATIAAGEGRVEAYAIKDDGTLQLLNSQPSGGKVPCHVSTDSKGRYVFVANYTGGNISCFPVKEDGSLGEATSTVQFTGSGPDKSRQKQAYAHAINTSADDRFVYACDLGSDKVWTFAFDPAKGTLTPTQPDAASVPPGGGPRHIAFHPTANFAYVNGEMDLQTTAFSRDPATGQLTALQTLPSSLTNPDPAPGVTTSEILCHPTGKWLYVSRRGDELITVYSIAADGKLTQIENVPSEAIVPRGMALDPTGKWLIVAGQKDNVLSVFKVDQETGKLTFTGEKVETPEPVSVSFVPTK